MSDSRIRLSSVKPHPVEWVVWWVGFVTGLLALGIIAGCGAWMISQ